VVSKMDSIESPTDTMTELLKVGFVWRTCC